MDRYLHLVAVIHRWTMELIARLHVIMDIKWMELQALFVAVMESGIQEQVQTVEVKGLF